jgi:hypothetical protein
MKPELTTLPALPVDDEGPVFRAPWEANKFGMTLALHERGHFTWKEWPTVCPWRSPRRAHTTTARAITSCGSRHWKNWLRSKLVLDVELQRRSDEWRRLAAETPHGKPIELKRTPS